MTEEKKNDLDQPQEHQMTFEEFSRYLYEEFTSELNFEEWKIQATDLITLYSEYLSETRKKS